MVIVTLTSNKHKWINVSVHTSFYPFFQLESSSFMAEMGGAFYCTPIKNKTIIHVLWRRVQPNTTLGRCVFCCTPRQKNV